MKLSRRSFLLGTAGAAVAAAVPGLPNQRALGGYVADRWYMVGERGPEFFVPFSDERVDFLISDGVRYVSRGWGRLSEDGSTLQVEELAQA